ncbi:hypothetical protein [uncultured Helicobacter sp.]|uniref:hypothetical protein n=1 Tax=uncultured Helicobacter sp. TaxID=175537 RepID=UPI00374F1FB7
MTQYYDFSFSLQPPLFSPTQLFFLHILNTQAKCISQNLTDTTFTPKHTLESHTPQSPMDSHTQDSNPPQPATFEYGFYTSADFARDSKSTLHFIIQTNHAPAVLDFAESIADTLPLSLSFCFLTLSVCDSLESLQPLAHTEGILPYTPHTHFCTATQTRDFLSDEHFGDFSLFCFAKPLAHTEEILPYLTSIIHELQSQKNVVLDTARGFKECSLKPFKNTDDTPSVCVMCDISSLKTFFRIHNAQSDVLASFEKPSVRLAPKEVFAQRFCKDSHGLVLTSLPYDPLLQLFSALLLREEITHFFLRPTSYTPERIFAHTPIDSHTLCVSESGLFLDTARAYCDFKTLLHTNLAHHTNAQNTQPSVILYISSKHPSAILLQNGGNFQQILNTSFEANPKHLIESIRTNYASGAELVGNFAHKQDITLFENLADISIRTDNLTHIFGIAALLLGMHPSSNLSTDTLLESLPQAYDSLLACANEFLRAKGPRIDYILQREHDTLTLDYPRIFRSSMSFKCADMDNVILAYGFIDSFCEFLATLVRDIQTNHAFGDSLEVLLCGDVFGHSIFLERILGFLPKNITLTLPQDGFLDYH